jgi:hypothetical protein
MGIPLIEELAIPQLGEGRRQELGFRREGFGYF